MMPDYYRIRLHMPLGPFDVFMPGSDDAAALAEASAFGLEMGARSFSLVTPTGHSLASHAPVLDPTAPSTQETAHA